MTSEEKLALTNIAEQYLYTNWNGNSPSVKEYAQMYGYPENQMWDGLRWAMARDAIEERKKSRLQKEIEDLELSLQAAVADRISIKRMLKSRPNVNEVLELENVNDRRVMEIRTRIGILLGA